MGKRTASANRPDCTTGWLEGRRLTDASLRRFLAINLGRLVSPSPIKQWEPRTLTSTAVYLNPHAGIAQKQFAVAQAAMISTDERPNPQKTASLKASKPLEPSRNRAKRKTDRRKPLCAARIFCAFRRGKRKLKIRESVPLCLLIAAALSGCAVEHYRPAPIVPARTASELENRSLNDPSLRQYMEKALGHPVSWPLRQWDLQTLTLAALYFNPQMEIARDRLAVAQGAISTAAERPNLTVSLKPAIPSPYLFGLSLVFPIETHGKRKLRIEQAKHLSATARISLAETAWQVSSGLRKALMAYQVARERWALDQSTERIEARQVALLGRMLAAGEGSRPSLQTAGLALSNIRFVIRGDEGQVATTRTALAGVIGVPVATLDGIQISWPDFARLPSLAELSLRRIQRDAVLNRLDVHRALEQYAAADAALRLQIAKQYPDFDIGPGYTFEEGDSFFAIPFSLVLPILNRNQGPVAQAEAFRKEAAANFLAVQAHAIAQSEQALAGYRSALAELDQANRPLEAQRLRVRMIQRAVDAGETDRLQLNSLLLEGAVYARQRLVSLAQAQAALGALEDAVEKPLGPDAFNSPARAATAAVSDRKEFDQ